MEYFNNKIICDLIEEKHKGIIAVLVRLNFTFIVFVGTVRNPKQYVILTLVTLDQ